MITPTMLPRITPVRLSGSPIELGSVDAAAEADGDADGRGMGRKERVVAGCDVVEDVLEREEDEVDECVDDL